MRIIALDVGEKRIGAAVADSDIRIALPRQMIPVDGNDADFDYLCRHKLKFTSIWQQIRM